MVTGVWTGKGSDGAGKDVDARERWADTWVRMPGGKVASSSAMCGLTGGLRQGKEALSAARPPAFPSNRGLARKCRKVPPVQRRSRQVSGRESQQRESP